MAWNGYRDNESDVGDGWDQMENCSFYIASECRRRLGFGAKVDLSGAVARAGGELGNYCLIGTAAGAVLSITQSSGAVASLVTGLSTTNWPIFAPGNGRLYYTNGVDAIRVSDTGTSLRTAGIVAPTVAATASGTSSGGVVTAGAHLVRYRWYDSSRNRLSNPSDAVSVTITAGQKVSAGYTASGDATVDKVIIEMTAVGAAAYYRVATITNSGSSTTVDVSDANLILGVSAARDGEFQHLPPPVVSVLLEHRQRLWGLSGIYLYWSRALFPESWDSVNYVRAVTMDAGDTPTAMASFYSDLYVFGSRSMRRVVYTSDPAAAAVYDVPGNFGAFNQRCVLKVDGGLMIGWGRNGAWSIDAMQPKKISARVDDTLASIASATALDQRFVCYEPIRREVLFVFPLAGSTTCKAALAYALDSGEITLWKWRQGMTAGVMNTQYTDRARLMLCDENGYAWRVGVLKNDGADSGTITAGVGSTTTILNGTNTAQVGQILYRPDTAEERLITAASGSQVTVGVAFATAPTSGEVLYAGSIRERLLSDWRSQGADQQQRPSKFLMSVRPSGTMGTGTVAFYQDFSATATPATAFAADTYPDGVDCSSGTVAVDFDIGAQDGFVPVPVSADWKRVVRAEIILEAADDGVVLLDADFKTDRQDALVEVET